MRRILLFFLWLMASVAVFAQNDVTKFLGIPVDGSKSEIIRKLKAKGFTTFIDDVLQGEFNGKDVYLTVGTNNNKVYRIMVSDANYTDETNIKIRFNNLCRQFQNNKKYYCPMDFALPEDEDISYEMSVNNKRYQAVFYQLPLGMDSVAFIKEIKTYVKSKYSQDELENATEEKAQEILSGLSEYAVERLSPRTVWFLIDESYGKYKILMYYDNEYNKANGEDL